jgi:hypothetical protein
MKDYVIVKTITTFTQTYLVPCGDDENKAEDVTNAIDLVEREKVKEFSQSFVGEQISTFDILSQAQMLKLFAVEKPWCGDDWTPERITEFVNDYEETETDTGAKV